MASERTIMRTQIAEQADCCLHESLWVLYLHLNKQTTYKRYQEAIRHLEYIGGVPVKRFTWQLKRSLAMMNQDLAYNALLSIDAWVNKKK